MTSGLLQSYKFKLSHFHYVGVGRFRNTHPPTNSQAARTPTSRPHISPRFLIHSFLTIPFPSPFPLSLSPCLSFLVSNCPSVTVRRRHQHPRRALGNTGAVKHNTHVGARIGALRHLKRPARPRPWFNGSHQESAKVRLPPAIPAPPPELLLFHHQT